MSPLHLCSSLGSPKVFGSRLHLHPLEGVPLPSPSICQDVPCPPVDPVGQTRVTATVISPVQVGCQAGVEPPACAIVLTTASRGVAIVVSVSSAEQSAIVVVALAVAQRVASITRVLVGCQTIPGRENVVTVWQTCNKILLKGFYTCIVQSFSLQRLLKALSNLTVLVLFCKYR